MATLTTSPQTISGASRTSFVPDRHSNPAQATTSRPALASRLAGFLVVLLRALAAPSV